MPFSRVTSGRVIFRKNDIDRWIGKHARKDGIPEDEYARGLKNVSNHIDQDGGRSDQIIHSVLNDCA